jgi:hypothetical protein
MAHALGEIVHAEDLWGDHHGAGDAPDHPQQGVPTDGEAFGGIVLDRQHVDDLIGYSTYLGGNVTTVNQKVMIS